MLCNLHDLLEGCLAVRHKRVALLIEGFPRPHHPITEFAKLLFLLREHGAKATFVVDWNDIRTRGLSTAVAQMVQLLKHNEHEVAVKFDPCSVEQLRQHAVEALHFLQRVYGITVVSAKVGNQLPVETLKSLGVAIVDDVRPQHIVKDSDDVLNDTELVLHDLRGRVCVCVSQMYY